MIYIQNNAESVKLFIEKHQDVDSSVKFVLDREADVETPYIESDDVEVHDNYYVHNLVDVDEMPVGRYTYKIADSSNAQVYEQGLMFVYDDEDIQAGQNLNDVVYEG